MRYRRNKDNGKLRRKDHKELAVQIDKSRHLGARLQMRFLEKRRSEPVTETTELNRQ
jgi:hypothetical protein